MTSMYILFVASFAFSAPPALGVSPPGRPQYLALRRGITSQPAAANSARQRVYSD
jgi:hypothetical protein